MAVIVEKADMDQYIADHPPTTADGVLGKVGETVYARRLGVEVVKCTIAKIILVGNGTYLCRLTNDSGGGWVTRLLNTYSALAAVDGRESD